MKTDKILRATHSGTLKIGDVEFRCVVLEDGTRVISGTGFMKGLGMYRSGALWTRRKDDQDGAQTPLFLAYKNLKPFVSDELSDVLKTQYEYLPKKGNRIQRGGIKGEAIPKICDVWLQARDAGVLKKTQLIIAAKADMLMRALAQVGIIALIDEATGYQYDREHDELARLLAVYLSEERLKWAKVFPDEFYRLIYKLKNWPFPVGTKRTQLIGKITNRIVYEKLPEGVLEKLRELNPKNPKTHRRSAKHFQHLSEDIGQEDLRHHLLQLIALLRAASNWPIFERLFARAFPTKEQLEEQRQKRLIPESEDGY